MITPEAVKAEMRDFLNSKNGVCEGAGNCGIELGDVLKEIVGRFGKKGLNSAEDVKRIKTLVNNFGTVEPFRTKKNKQNLIAICFDPLRASAMSGFAEMKVLPADPVKPPTQVKPKPPKQVKSKAPTQAEVVKAIAASTELPQATIKLVLQEFQKELESSLKASGKFSLNGICTVEVFSHTKTETGLTLRPLKVLREMGVNKDASTD